METLFLKDYVVYICVFIFKQLNYQQLNSSVFSIPTPFSETNIPGSQEPISRYSTAFLLSIKSYIFLFFHIVALPSFLYSRALFSY